MEGGGRKGRREGEIFSDTQHGVTLAACQGGGLSPSLPLSPCLSQRSARVGRMSGVIHVERKNVKRYLILLTSLPPVCPASPLLTNTPKHTHSHRGATVIPTVNYKFTAPQRTQEKKTSPVATTHCKPTLGI